MRVPTETPYSYAWRRLVSSLRPWSRRRNDARLKPNFNRRFSIPLFDADSEQLFWQERQSEAISTLKTVLLLGASCFMAFISLEVFNGDLLKNEIIAHSITLLAISLLFASLHLYPQSKNHINKVAKLSATFAVVDLSWLLFVADDPELYNQIWVGLLPIYFFAYGQMFMTIAETLKFGLLAMIALPLSGYLVGVDTMALLPSILILLIINAFGFCTRSQLEAHARNLFLERRKAESASEDKTQFLRQLSHNLRQPLQALNCYTSLLDAAFADRPDRQEAQMVGKLGSAIDDLNVAFTHILDIANLETGQQIPKLAAVDINALLLALENQFAPQAAQRGLKLKVCLRSRPPYTVYSDASILNQILGNLIDNAIKYTARGWIVIAAVKVDSERLKLHVRDSGMGIAEDLQGEIFKEFFRCHRRQVDTQVNGLGIGLAYVAKATERLQNHRLKVYSRPQRGSDFQLYLPVIDAVMQRFDALSKQPRFTDSFVFIVGGQQALKTMAEQLTAWGCLVQQATSKAETRAALAENFRPPDLLITHFYLDDKETAHDIIATIQADCGQVPTLILSSHAIMDEDKAKWPKNTVLLRKPASEAVLMEMMAKAMGK